MKAIIPIGIFLLASLPLKAFPDIPATGIGEAEMKEWLQKKVTPLGGGFEVTLGRAARMLGSDRDRAMPGSINIVILSPELAARKIRIEASDQSIWNLLQELAEKADAQVVISGNVVEIHPEERKIPVPVLEGEALERLDSASIPLLRLNGVSLKQAVENLNRFSYSAGVDERSERRNIFPAEAAKPPVVLDAALDDRVIVPDLLLKRTSVAVGVRYLALIAGLDLKVEGKSVLLLPGKSSVLRERTFKDEALELAYGSDGESMMSSLRRGRMVEQIRTFRSDPRDWERELVELIHKDSPSIADTFNLIEVRGTWGKPVVVAAMQERVARRMARMSDAEVTRIPEAVISHQRGLRECCVDLLNGDRPENYTYLLERLRGPDTEFIAAVDGRSLEELHRKMIEGLKADDLGDKPEAVRLAALEERKMLLENAERNLPEPRSREGDAFQIRLFSALEKFGGKEHLEALEGIEERMRKEERSASLVAAVKATGRAIRERVAKGLPPQTPEKRVLTEPRVIERGRGTVTLPDGLVIEKESWGDEGDHWGVLLERKSGLRLRFSISSFSGSPGYHPKDIDWPSVLYFERSPEGWYGAQYLVADNGQELSVVAIHGFIRAGFSTTLPKGADYRPVMDLLKSIKVEMEEEWEVIRGEKFDEIEVRPKNRPGAK
ncbi:MAG: hypothetical protein EOP87_10415 [Verrucomicrobiaceae bacterium]|nr:MAG: hypothetical protein EOP87_10415 [Verrucomicrobiaceae bacterium]